MRRSLAAAVVAGLALSTFLPAQADGLPADHDCRIEIADPVPWLEALLQSDGLRDAVRLDALGDAIALAGGGNWSPAQWVEALRTFRPFLPQRITLAWPTATAGKLGNLTHLFVALMLLNCVAMTESSDRAALAAEILPKVLENLEATADLRFALRVDCRDERTAEQWFESLGDFADGLAGQTDLVRCEHGADAFHLVFAPGTGLSRGEVRSLLSGWLIFAAADEPDAPDAVLDGVWRTLQRIGIHLHVALRGDQLAIELGDAAPQAGSVAAKAAATTAGALLDGARPIAQAHYDLTSLVTELRATLATIDRWRPTELGALMVSLDDQHLLEDIEEFLADVEPLAIVDAAIGWDEDGVRWVTVTPITAAVPIVDHPLWRLLPETTWGYGIDGRVSLGDFLCGAVRSIENRLASSSLRELVDGDATTTASDLEAQWYELVRTLRPMLFDEARSLWRAPMLWLGAAHQRQEEFDCHGLAFATALADPEGGLPFARRLFAEIAAAAALDLDDFPSGFARDLGLGVATIAFWRHDDAVDDFCPHAFEWQGHLVFSTSVATSRAMLAGGPFRPASADPSLIAASAGNGHRLGDALFHGVLDLSRAVREPLSAGEVALSPTVIAGAVASVLRLAGPIRSESTIQGDRVVTRGRILAAGVDPNDALAAIVARARAALGPWPEGVEALAMSGTAHGGRGDEGPFRLVFTPDGHYRNRIDLASSEQNCDWGDHVWGVVDGNLPVPPTAEQRDLLKGFALAFTGQWTEPPAGFHLAMAPDRVPGGPDELMLIGPSGAVTRLRLDPATGRTAAVAYVGESSWYATWYRLDGYASHGGRWLPHAALSSTGSGYRDAAWQDVAFAAVDATPPLPAASVAFVAAGEVETRRSDRYVLELAAVHGSRKVWLALVPVSPETRLSRAAAEALGAVVAPGASVARVPEVAIGPMMFRNLPVHIEGPDDLNGAGSEDARAGIIGAALLLRCCAELDAEVPSLRLQPPGAFAEDGGFVPVTWLTGLPIVPVAWGKNVTVPCTLPLTSPIPLQLGAGAVVAGAPLSRKRIRAIGSMTDHDGLVAFTASDLRIGDVPLGGVSLVAPLCRRAGAAPPYPSALGRQLAERFILRFDLPASRIAIVPR